MNEFKLKVLKEELEVRVYVDKLPPSCDVCNAKKCNGGVWYCRYLISLAGNKGVVPYNNILMDLYADRRDSRCPLIERPMSDEEKQKEHEEKTKLATECKQRNKQYEIELKQKCDTTRPNNITGRMCQHCYYSHVAVKENPVRMSGGYGYIIKKPVYCNATGEKKFFTSEQAYILYYQGKPRSDNRNEYDILPEWCHRRNLP